MIFGQIYSNSYNGALVHIIYKNNAKSNYYSVLSQVLKKLSMRWIMHRLHLSDDFNSFFSDSIPRQTQKKEKVVWNEEMKKIKFREKH